MTRHHPKAILDETGLPLPDPDFAAKRREAFRSYFEASATLADGDLDEPALFAVDPGDWRDLSARIPGLLVTTAGGAMPFQSEGTLRGLDYYFKYRYGTATLRVGGTLFAPLYSASLTHGGEWDGILSRAEFVDLMLRLVPLLSRAPMQWQFSGTRAEVAAADEIGDITVTVTETPEIYYGWGHTPAEAHASIGEFSAYLSRGGFTAAKQAELFSKRQIDPAPINADERVYPDPEPVFEVLW